LRAIAIALFALVPLAAQSRFEKFNRDVAAIQEQLRIKISTAVVENGRLLWKLDAFGPKPAGPFQQTYSDEQILWEFAQTDDSSYLTVNVPSRKLKLDARASSPAMTEAAHLEDGNILRSAVALAFLVDVVGLPPSPRDEMENRALTALYLGQRDQSAAIIGEALKKFPELESSDDLTLLHLLADLHLPAIESVATVVLMKHPDLPAAWLYYGKYLRSQRRFREATLCFKQITEHQPPLNDPAVAEANKELSTLE